MTEDITTTENVFEAKAVEITTRIANRILSAAPLAGEMQHITDCVAEALQEAVREAEQPLLRKIVELSAKVQRVEEINENLRAAVRDQPIKWNDEYYEMRLKEARLQEREECVKIAQGWRPSLIPKSEILRMGNSEAAIKIATAIRSRS